MHACGPRSSVALRRGGAARVLPVVVWDERCVEADVCHVYFFQTHLIANNFSPFSSSVAGSSVIHFIVCAIIALTPHASCPFSFVDLSLCIMVERSIMASSVNFVIGNTYSKIDPSSRAKWDRTGNYRKVHDWTLYLDVLGGNADIIKKVDFVVESTTFNPRKFTSHCPVKVLESKWRFQTRQQTYGSVMVKVTIIGRGGSVLRSDHMVTLSPGGSKSKTGTFVERRPNKALTPVPIVDCNFGIELELSTSSYVPIDEVARSIQSRASVDVRDMTHDYAAGRDAASRSDGWTLVPDGSIVCSTDRPDCFRFELVSPVLRGGNGLGEVDRVVRALGDIPSMKVNASMGYHVHVDVSELEVSDVVKVCQNFVKYEEAMDRLVPRSRREGNTYCKSNRTMLGEEGHDVLACCTSLAELGELMSPDKYHKLNMRNIVTCRQPTIEFRQHSATFNKEKVKNWIRFCVAFVHNSAKYKAPSELSRSVNDEELFEMLVMYVIKDRYLRDFYRQRRAEVSGEPGNCCDGCASGGRCDAGSRPSKFLRQM
ncbi:hypothetical protein ACHAWF_009785 [Thalassiosira exigua]